MLKFKVQYGDDLRQISFDSYDSIELEAFANMIQDNYGVNWENVTLMYEDNDGDWVTIANARDMKEAAIYMEGEGLNTLKMVMKLKHGIQIAAASQQLTAYLPEIMDFIETLKAKDEKMSIEQACSELQSRVLQWNVDEISEGVQRVLLDLLEEPETLDALHSMKESAEFEQVMEILLDALAKQKSTAELIQLFADSENMPGFILMLQSKCPNFNRLLHCVIPMLLSASLQQPATSEDSVPIIKEVLSEIKLDIVEEKLNTVHDNVCCDGCAANPIVGIRYKSCSVGDYDLCADCEQSGRYVEFEPFMKIRHPSKSPLEDNTLHQMIICDGCEANPIRGIRYQSVSVSNFDLCMKCEASGRFEDSHGPFVKLRKPTNHRVKMCHVARDNRKEYRAQVKAARRQVKEARKAAKSAAKQAKQAMKQVKVSLQSPIPLDRHFNAEFVSDETFPDGSALAPSALFVKSWKLRNNGNCDWPEGCVITSVGGESLAEGRQVQVPPLSPGQEFSPMIQMRAPSTPGRYISYWRLSHPDGERFGHRFWVDIVVDESIVPAAAKEAQVPVAIPVCKENTLDTTEDCTDEEETTESQVEVMGEHFQYREEGELLIQMGFLDIPTNLSLLEEYHGDMERVLDQLC